MPTPAPPEAAPFALRLAEHLHGHFGWLAAAALSHPALLLRNPKRRAGLAIGLSVGIVTVIAAAGAAIYPDYRSRLKQQIFIHARATGLIFERKEHLAFAAVALAWAGALAYLAADRRGVDAEARTQLRKVAHVSFVIAAAFALVVAVMGTYVASYSTF